MEKITAVIKSLIHRSLIALGYRLERIPSRHPAAAVNGARDQDGSRAFRSQTFFQLSSSARAELFFAEMQQ
jgi:hypothetical protein